MRISWLEPAVVRQVKDALLGQHTTWEELFTPEFQVPQPPQGIDIQAWPHIAEHVARAERVTALIRSKGFENAVNMFATSSHAVEQATLVAAANHIETARFDLVERLLSSCHIDDLVIYGNFLHLLTLWGASNQATLGIYERFCSALCAAQSNHPMWNERVCAARDGLASFYVTCGQHDRAHQLFIERHDEQPEDLIVALCASRVFLSAKVTGRSILWLGLAADRAHSLGKQSIEQRLRTKITKLRNRLS